MSSVSGKRATDNLLRGLEREFASLHDDEVIAELREAYGDENVAIAELDRIVDDCMARRRTSTTKWALSDGLLDRVRDLISLFFMPPKRLGYLLVALTIMVSTAIVLFYFDHGTGDIATTRSNQAVPVEVAQPTPSTTRDFDVSQHREANRDETLPDAQSPTPELTPAPPIDPVERAKRGVDVASQSGDPPLPPKPLPKPEETWDQVFNEKLLTEYKRQIEECRIDIENKRVSRYIAVAASHGDVNALVCSAASHDFGFFGVRHDAKEAMKFYRRAAPRSVFAQIRLAFLLEEPPAFERRPTAIRNSEALRLYTSAAKQGSALAKERLALAVKSVKPKGLSTNDGR